MPPPLPPLPSLVAIRRGRREARAAAGEGGGEDLALSCSMRWALVSGAVALAGEATAPWRLALAQVLLAGGLGRSGDEGPAGGCCGASSSLAPAPDLTCTAPIPSF